MPFVFKSLALLLSISAGFAADKETPFKAAPAASYANHQSNAQITIGVDPYVTLDKVQLAFGKLQPNQYGILPVLVVIQNDSDKAIRLDRRSAPAQSTAPPVGSKCSRARRTRWTNGRSKAAHWPRGCSRPDSRPAAFS